MKISLRSLFGSIFGFKEPQKTNVNVRSGVDFRTKAIENQVWYNGETTGLLDFYRELGGSGAVDLGNRFWVASQKNSLIRKMHSGLPKLMIDKIASIVVNDMLTPQIDDKECNERWVTLDEVIKLKDKVQDSIVKTAVQGDGAYKLGWDIELTDYPLVEFYDALHTDYVYKQGFLVEVVFKDEIEYKNNTYVLNSHYGYGYITYKLYKVNSNGENVEVDLNMTPETEFLEDIDLSAYGLEGVMLAVPFRIKESNLYKGRGESLYHGKYESFDALDEVVSSWMDAVRSGRTKIDTPMDMVPIDPNTGAKLPPDPFNQYQETRDQFVEGKTHGITVIQPDIKYEGYVTSYTTFLDLSLQGVISPSTLGIDVKKMDNAESQREKEKTTIYTRDTIITVLEKLIPELISKILYVDSIIHSRPIHDCEISISFGQYANPSFETLVKTVSEARERNIISIESAVEELWGDSKSVDWKAEEVERLREELELKHSDLTKNSPPTESSTES